MVMVAVVVTVSVVITGVVRIVVGIVIVVTIVVIIGIVIIIVCSGPLSNAQNTHEKLQASSELMGNVFQGKSKCVSSELSRRCRGGSSCSSRGGPTPSLVVHGLFLRLVQVLLLVALSYCSLLNGAAMRLTS